MNNKGVFKDTDNIESSYPWLFIALGLTISILLSFGSTLSADINWIKAIIFGTVIMMIYKSFKEGYGRFILIPVVFIAVAIILFRINNPAYYYGTILKLNDFSWWLSDLLSMRIIINGGLAAILIYLLILPVFFIFLFIMSKDNKYPLLIGVGLGLITFQWIFISTAVWQYAFIYGLFIVCLNAIDNFRRIKRGATTRGLRLINFEYNAWSTMAFTLGILVFLLVLIMPKNIKPMDWSWFDRQLSRFDSVITMDSNIYRNGVKTKGRYGVDILGYQKSPTLLGGPTDLKDNLVLRVKSPLSTYLRGTVKINYTGSSWEYTDDNDEIFQGTVIASSQYSSKVDLNYVNMDVEIVDLNTSTVFLPLQPRIVRFQEGHYYLTKDLEVYKHGFIPPGEKYSLVAVIPEVNIEKLGQRPEVTFDMTKYLLLPDNYSMEVKQHTIDITTGITDNYQKAEAIRDYLRAHYKYDLSPSPLPQGKDFVEHFLFTERTGYCTYFASSMAVMARIAGIPSRYVEGFIMPQNPEEDGYYNITGELAHAWVELYFQDYGWLPFEATPAYSTNYERLEVILSSSDNLLDIEEDMDVDADDIENLIKEIQKDINQRDNTTQGSKDISRDTLVIAMIVLALIGILSGCVIFYYKLRGINLEYYGGRFEKGYLLLIALISKLDTEIYEGETLKEYVYRIKNSDSIRDIDINQLTELFYKTRYGDRDIDATASSNLLSALQLSTNRLKKRLGWLKYRLEITKLSKKIN